MYSVDKDLELREKCIDFAIKANVVSNSDVGGVIDAAQKFYWFITAKVNKDDE